MDLDENSNQLNSQFYRIDYYWRNISKIKAGLGMLKCKILPTVVKSAFCLHHGSGYKEGLVLNNKKLLTKEKRLLSRGTLKDNFHFQNCFRKSYH